MKKRVHVEIPGRTREEAEEHQKKLVKETKKHLKMFGIVPKSERSILPHKDEVMCWIFAGLITICCLAFAYWIRTF